MGHGINMSIIGQPRWVHSIRYRVRGGRVPSRFAQSYYDNISPSRQRPFPGRTRVQHRADDLKFTCLSGHFSPVRARQTAARARGLLPRARSREIAEAARCICVHLRTSAVEIPSSLPCAATELQTRSSLFRHRTRRRQHATDFAISAKRPPRGRLRTQVPGRRQVRRPAGPGRRASFDFNTEKKGEEDRGRRELEPGSRKCLPSNRPATHRGRPPAAAPTAAPPRAQVAPDRPCQRPHPAAEGDTASGHEDRHRTTARPQAGEITRRPGK